MASDKKDLEKILAEQVAETARVALKNLVTQKKLPWPDIYSEEFWKVAKRRNLSSFMGTRSLIEEITQEMLQDFIDKTGSILDGVRETVEDFVQVTKEQVSDMKESIEAIDEKDKENVFYEDIAKLLVINKTLEAKTKETERKIEEQSKIINELKGRLRIDPLTKLFNRQALEVDLKKEISKIKRYNYPLSLIMCDIDYFKNVNDTYGHQIGDKILQKLANIWKQIIRDTDSIYRYGGEEFIIIAPHTTKEEAYLLAERLRKQVKNYKFIIKSPNYAIRITISLGVIQVKQDESIEQALRRVDEALYLAKKQGRDQTVVL